MEGCPFGGLVLGLCAFVGFVFGGVVFAVVVVLFNSVAVY